MIAECLIFLATALPQNGFITTDYVENYQFCDTIVTRNVREHSELLIETFEDPIQLNTAIKVIWCESRGNTDALRTAEGNNDSGLFQFVSWTWNWVAEEYDLPMWDEWVVMRFGKPYTGPTSKSAVGFEFKKVQHTEYYNIQFGYLLSQDIYGRSQWKDWSSSEWCWKSDAKYINKLRKEQGA